MSFACLRNAPLLQHCADGKNKITFTTNSTCWSTGRVAPGAAFAFAVAISSPAARGASSSRRHEHRTSEKKTDTRETHTHKYFQSEFRSQGPRIVRALRFSLSYVRACDVVVPSVVSFRLAAPSCVLRPASLPTLFFTEKRCKTTGYNSEACFDRR